MLKNLLMVIGCVLGVIGGAADLKVSGVGPLPLNWCIAAVGGVFLVAAFVIGRSRPGGGAAESAGTQTSIGDAQNAIRRAAVSTRAILQDAATLEIAALAARIDAMITQDLYPVIGAQSELMRVQGFSKYASHTGPWAAGERMIYRAWSAATDGHRPEAVASLREAVLHFEEAAKA